MTYYRFEAVNITPKEIQSNMIISYQQYAYK